jgi:hypothetical protein
MDRRGCLLGLGAATLLRGCDTEQQPSGTASLLNNSGIQEAMKRLADAIDGLGSQIGQFDSGDSWREVVPEVRSAASDVESAFSALRSELGITA